MNQPDVVDLRSAPVHHSPAPAPSTGGRRTALAGLLVFVLGGALGWLLATPGDTDDPAAGGADVPVDQAPEPVGRSDGALEGTGGGVGTDVPSLVPVPAADGSSVEVMRPRVIAADVTVLAGAGELEGAIVLIPGLQNGTRVRLTPDGAVGVLDSAATPALTGEFNGLGLAEVAGGILFVPTEQSFGAVAYWTAPRGIQLAVSEAPYRTSYLAAAGDLAVFLSDGDVVVRDLRRAEYVLRTPGRIAGESVVHACLSPDAAAIALVSATGDIVVVDIEAGDAVAMLSTDTARFGISWAGPTQLARLAPSGDSQLVVATDLTTGADHEVARVDGGAGWRLTTEGTGC